MMEFYNYSIVAGWVTCLILGVCLLWCRVPDMPTYRTYLRSRRILGVAYLVFAIGISQFTFFNLRATNPQVAVALQLSYFYIEAILWGMSFCSLLDHHYISRRKLTLEFGLYVIFIAVAWGGALVAESRVSIVMLVVASAWFFIKASGISIRFLKIYSRAKRRINEYYADNVEGFVMWLHNSTYIIIFLGLSSSILAFCPRWCNAVFMLCGTVLFTYVFISFQNYILNYPEVSTVLEAEEPIVDSASNVSDSCEVLRKGVEEWIAHRGFTESGVTLEKLATTVGVNRSYVSAFINSEYKCNFRELVNTHRLEYAKQILKDNPDTTIDRISQEAGFSSAAYFSRLFTKQEGITPSRWRDTHGSLP